MYLTAFHSLRVPYGTLKTHSAWLHALRDPLEYQDVTQSIKAMALLIQGSLCGCPGLTSKKLILAEAGSQRLLSTWKYLGEKWGGRDKQMVPGH